MKCLFWCLHELSRHYSLNLVLHSIERRYVHPDLQNTHLGDVLAFLMSALADEDLERLQDALGHMATSRASMEVGEKRFEIGHYVQALESFGPIAEDSYGIICSVTPELRGLFCLEGATLMESAFAPSDARVIYGTYPF